MPMRRGVKPSPVEHVVAGGWPHAELDGSVEAAVAQQFARRLVDAVGDRGWREIAREAGVDHKTVAAVARGHRWVDSVTLARLEQVLGPLWPGTG